MDELNESNEASEQQKHPADALADLANGSGDEIAAPHEQVEVDPLSALDKMAQSSGEPSADDLAAAAVEVADNEISDHVFSANGAPLESARGLHVTTGDGHQRHLTHLYKKFMIPLLVLVGAVLLIISFIAYSMLARATPEQQIDKWYSRMKLVMYVSFPLAVAVIIGAWWFWRDVKKGG